MDTIEQAHARLLADLSLQLRFPAPLPEEPVPLPTPGLHAGPEVFWVVIAVVAVVLAAVVVQALWGRGLPSVRVAAAGDEGVPEPAPVLVLPARILADADALAGGGAYGEAVHALLLRGVAAIQARFPRALTPGHTSRDIAALTVLPPALAHAFSGIAAHAERAVFARRPLGRAEWEACRALYAGLPTA